MTSEEYEIQQFDKLCQEYRKKINELEDKIDSIKQDSAYWFGQANRNYEDCHNEWTKKVRAETAKDIYKKVDELSNSPEYDPRDTYDCNALVAYNSVKEFIKRKYGVEVDDE